LLATFPPTAVLPEGWTPIGEVRASRKPGVRVDGQAAEDAARVVGAEGTGHVHFR
jgi:thiamine-monophosphate kinase